jgi:hypothetical protein
MKSARVLSLTVGVTLLLTLSLATNARPAGEEFSVKQYEDFHHLLHELQHDALPKKDFARIRSKADELVELGGAIVKLGVPEGTATAKREEFEKGLRAFKAALAKFKKDAKTGTDDEMTVSYSAVHDSFEALAEQLPPPKS